MSGPSMRTIEVTKVIEGPVDAVWAWLADANNFRRVPGTLSVRVAPGPTSPNGVGSSKTLLTPLLRVTEEVTRFEPPHRLDYQIVESTPRLIHHGGSIRLTSLDPQRTGVTWTSTLAVSSPVFRAPLTRFYAEFISSGIKMTLRTLGRTVRRNQLSH